MKYLQFCHVINTPKYWISTCTCLLTWLHLIKSYFPSVHMFKRNNRCATTCSTPRYRENTFKEQTQSLSVLPGFNTKCFHERIQLFGWHFWQPPKSHRHYWSKILKSGKNILPWDICVFSDLASVVNAEPTAVLWDMLALPEESVPKDVKEPPALKEII